MPCPNYTLNKGRNKRNPVNLKLYVSTVGKPQQFCEKGGVVQRGHSSEMTSSCLVQKQSRLKRELLSTRLRPNSWTVSIKESREKLESA